MPLPFEDDFDEGPRPEWEPVLGAWRMVDGTYATDEADGWAYTMVGDPGWRDYAVEVDLTVDCITGYPTAILLRSSGPGEGIRFEFDCCRMEWIVWHDGQSKSIATADRGLPYKCHYWTTSRLRLEAEGNTYSAYLDGMLVVRVQDDSFAAGRAGLGTTHDSNIVRFDNFLIAPLP
jgi:hypothetical protein